MDIFDETKVPLKAVWDNEIQRQQSKILIMAAIGEATQLSVKESQEILLKLDDMLLGEEEDNKKKPDPAR